MLQPRTPIEAIDAEDFVPEHCPREGCAQFKPPPEGEFRYIRWGAYYSRPQRRVIPRFRCKACGRTFSMQSFAITIYLRHPEFLLPIAEGMVAASAYRQLARSLRCDKSTVAGQAARINRQMMLAFEQMLGEIKRIDEVLVLDTFETFVGNQFAQYGSPQVVGAKTGFVYQVDHFPHRRKGKFNPFERKERARIEARDGKAARGASRPAIARVFRRLMALHAGHLYVNCDGEPDFPEVLAGIPGHERVHLSIYRNVKRGPKRSPRTAAARRRDRAMRRIDRLHDLLRHTMANHRRETKAHARSRAYALGRLITFAVWRNLLKRVSENKARSETPAMRAGVADHPWSWAEILGRRRFRGHHSLPDHLEPVYHATLDDQPKERTRRVELVRVP